MARRSELDVLVADLGEMPATLRRELKPALRRAARPILTEARRRASYSSRIPAAISVRSSLGGRTSGLRLVVDAGRAPHARPLELGSQRNGTFVRHPVFGDRETWVSQRTRPFFFPAVYAGASRVADEAATAVQTAARTVGFR